MRFKPFDVNELILPCACFQCTLTFIKCVYACGGIIYVKGHHTVSSVNTAQGNCRLTNKWGFSGFESPVGVRKNILSSEINYLFYQVLIHCMQFPVYALYSQVSSFWNCFYGEDRRTMWAAIPQYTSEWEEFKWYFLAKTLKLKKKKTNNVLKIF